MSANRALTAALAARRLLSAALIGSMCISIACDEEAAEPSGSGSRAQVTNERAGGEASARVSANREASNARREKTGFTIQGDGIDARADTAATVLPGYSQAPLRMRLMAGWIDVAGAAAAARETDEAKQRQRAMQSFGMLTMTIDCGTAEAGQYALQQAASDSAAVIKLTGEEALGIAKDVTSTAGTLTIKSIDPNAKGTVDSFDASYDGTFVDADGKEYQLKGLIRVVAK